MRDGAWGYRALRTQRLVQEKSPNIKRKGMWPANSHGLKPIENLWSILGVQIKEQSKPTWSIQRLERILNKAWKKISRGTLEIRAGEPANFFWAPAPAPHFFFQAAPAPAPRGQKQPAPTGSGSGSLALISIYK